MNRSKYVREIVAISWLFLMAFAWAGILCAHVLKPISLDLERYAGNCKILAGAVIFGVLFLPPFLAPPFMARLVRGCRVR